MNGKRIVIISSEAWGDVFVSKHHYAKVLSETNKVFFLNPPSFKWQLSSLLAIPIKTKNINENLIVVDYGNPFPFLFHLPYFLQILAFKIIISGLSKKVKDLKFPDLVWSFDLKRFYDLKAWGAEKSIFHAVELIDHPLFIKDAPFRHKVVKSANLVVVIADLIKNQASQHNSNILKINHGIDIKSFEDVSSSVKLPGMNKIKAGFVGNFQMSFDFELLRQLSSENRNIDFILVGPVVDSNLGKMHSGIQANIQNLKNEANVFFLGKVPSEDLPSYMASFDLNLIIYQDDFHAGHCNPHKLMSYFYFGKVTVSSFIDEYKNQPKLIQMVRKNKDLPALFSEVVKEFEQYNPQDLQTARRQFALDHDYSILINKIGQILKENDFNN